MKPHLSRINHYKSPHFRWLSSRRLPDHCNILAIETSCDDTCVSIVSFSPTDRHKPYEVLFDRSLHQPDLLKAYGGVYPFKAAERHRAALPELLGACSHIPIHAIAATRGPGLAPCVAVGWNAAKMLAARLAIPLISVHHMEAHALVARATNPTLTLPFISLLISGGHTMLVRVDNRSTILPSDPLCSYKLLGNTLDIAAGEALDKGARLLQLSEPTGAALSRLADQSQDINSFRFSLPISQRPSPDFSFSGLLTELSKYCNSLVPEDPRRIDLAASYQQAIVQHVTDRVKIVLPGSTSLVLSGGVACNTALQRSLSKLLSDNNMDLLVPPPALCTDNAFMIAWAAIERIWCDPINLCLAPLTLETAPVWPLDN